MTTEPEPNYLPELAIVETPDEAPRCRMCDRPARWLSKRGTWAVYCDGKQCLSRERICQNTDCGATFQRDTDGADNRFCSAECKDKVNPYSADPRRRGSTHHWRHKIRPYVLNRDGWICQLCDDDQPMDPHADKNDPKAPQVHHTRDPELGDDPEFLVAAHRECNLKAGSPAAPKQRYKTFEIIAPLPYTPRLDCCAHARVKIHPATDGHVLIEHRHSTDCEIWTYIP